MTNCSFTGNFATYRGASLTFSGFTFLNKLSTVDSSTFSNNNCTEGGAGIYAEFSLGKLQITGSHFRHNSGFYGAAVYHNNLGSVSGRGNFGISTSDFSYNSGGSILYVEGIIIATVVTTSCTFNYNSGSSVIMASTIWNDTLSSYTNNSGTMGGAANLEESTATITSCTYIGNNVTQNGGALHLSQSSVVTCWNCTFIQNSCTQTGGAVYTDRSAVFTGINNLYFKNYAKDKAAALYADRSTVTLVNSNLTYNQAGNYGTVFISSGTLNMSYCDMSFNVATARSPGVVSSLGTVTISYSQFHDQVGVKGGCLFFSDQSTGVMSFSRVWNCTATTGGAFVIIALSVFTFQDSTATNCSAPTDGGFMTCRISTITITRSAVSHITSIMTYGALFLLQCTVALTDSTFTDLTASAAYGIVSGIAITNCTFARISASLGAGLNCGECTSITVTNSKFSYGLAKIGGAISSYTKGTSATALTSVYTNNRFENNQAVIGGAIYSDSFYMNLTRNTFINNRVSASYFSTAQVMTPGLGGAVYSVCSSVSFCEFDYVQNNFTNNAADVSGGAVYWADSYPTIKENVMSGNTAVYGDDIASFAVRLALLDKTDSIQAYLKESSAPLVVVLSNVGSGQVYTGELRLALVDQYGNIVTTDYSSSAQLQTSNNSLAKISGNNQVVAQQGIFEFSNFTIIGPPTTSQTITVATNGISLLKKNTTHDPNLYFPAVTVGVDFRDCEVGESLQGNECNPCPVNTFSLDPSQACMSCPNHVTCYGTYIMVPQPGYWRPNPKLNLFFQCLYAEACLGSPDPENPSLTGLCAVGYTNNLCSACANGYSSQGNGICSHCPSVSSNMILLSFLALTLLSLFIIVVFVAIRSATRPRSELAIYLKILLNFMQMIMVAASLNLNWPDYVQTFLRGQQVAGNAANQLLSIDCLLMEFFTQSVYYTTVGVYAVAPGVLIVVAIVFWLLMALLTRVKDTRQKLVVTIVLVVFILHTSLTKVMFSIFTCTELLPGEYWLASNLSIRCWNQEHIKNILTLTIPGLVLWVIGLPTLCLAKLVSLKRSLNDAHVKMQFSFLYKGYKQELYFWEFVILYRKIVIVCTAVFLTTVSVVIQALSMLAVILICLFLQLYVKPFYADSFNQLELKALLASLLTIYAGLYFQTNSTRKRYAESAVNIVIFLVIILANAYFLIGWLRLVLPLLISTLRQKIAALRKYTVDAIGTSKDIGDHSMNKLSSVRPVDQDEVRYMKVPSSLIHPESVDVPDNTSNLDGDGSLSGTPHRRMSHF